MDVSQTSQVTAATSSSSSQSDSASLVANSDFETFLKLLTTQLENQDPLKPLDSTEFVGQLASFSAVEQQILTNTRLAEMSSAMSASQASYAADWLGKSVLSPASAQFKGEPIEVSWDAFASATRSTLEVTNSSGDLIATEPLELNAKDLIWDGKTADGTTAPDGTYSFNIKRYDGDELIHTDTGRTYSEVQEVQIESGGLKLVLSGGDLVYLDEIRRIAS